MSDKVLFSPYKVGAIELNNRVVMAPMTRSRAVENNAPNDRVATYYGQRASAGLIISEGTSPSPNGVGYPRIPGIYNRTQIEAWKEVTDKVHEKGGKIFLQLMHVGRVGHVDNLPEGGEFVAPTTQVLSGEMYTDAKGPQSHSAPRLMTNEDISAAIGEFVRAAKNAINAGFDGVEIHAANGYLIEQFINKKVNELDKEYGGSIENRSRFAIEVTQGIVNAIGKDRVGLRISPYGVFNGMPDYDDIDETYNYLIGELNKIGIAYLHLLDHSGMGAPEVPKSLKTSLRKNFKGTFILCGDYNVASAEEELASDGADLIAFGRPFVSNPDLVERMRHGADLTPPDFNTFYTPDEKGYTDYPFLKEKQLA